MNSPSPLVPQGAIPPKTTSRPQRVLMIAAMVVGLHVAGLSLVLFQGCGKNDLKQTASNAETNTTPAMNYPTDTNMGSSMFASANTNATGGGAVGSANTNLTPAPIGAFGGPTAGTPGAVAGIADQGIATPPAAIDNASAGPTKEYKIQKGETLSAIATKNGVSLSAIVRANPGLDPKKLRVGQAIKIPAAPTAGVTGAAGTGSTPPTTIAGAATGATAAPPIGAAGTYKVKAGDTLTKIAKAHGITVNQLRAANNMKTTQVQVGKVLKIPARTQKTAAAPTNTASTH